MVLKRENSVTCLRTLPFSGWLATYSFIPSGASMATSRPSSSLSSRSTGLRADSFSSILPFDKGPVDRRYRGQVRDTSDHPLRHTRLRPARSLHRHFVKGNVLLFLFDRFLLCQVRQFLCIPHQAPRLQSDYCFRHQIASRVQSLH
jgi:hypothetical protein